MIVPMIFLLLFSANGQKSGQGYYSRNGPSNWLLDKNSMTRKISELQNFSIINSSNRGFCSY